MSDLPTHLFVYGTLKTQGDERVSPLLNRGLNVGPHQAAIVYGYTLYLPNHRAYPMALPSDPGEGRDAVQGEVVELKNPEFILPILDSYEGISSGLYRREVTDAYLDNGGEQVRAYIYVATAESVKRHKATPIGSYWSREAFR